MAAPSKRRAVEDEMKDLENATTDDNEELSDISEDDDGESEDEKDDMLNEEIQVDFEARTAEDSDFHGITRLLHQVFLKANINTSELADFMISQNYVGSVIKQCEAPDEEFDDDDDTDPNEVFGVTTVLNITEKKDKDCIKQLRYMIMDRCKQCLEGQKKEQFLSMMESSTKPVGLLINERFINIPAQIALPLFESLRKEMEKARERKLKFHFDYYLMISKTTRPKPKKGKKKNKDKTQLTFINSEEELFYQESVMCFSYCVNNERDTVLEGPWEAEEEVDSYRTIMLIPAEKLNIIITQLADILG